VAPFISLSFAVFQVGAVAIGSLAPAVTRNSDASWAAPAPDLFTLSQSKNVVHVVLDAFLSELFDDALREDRAWFDRTYQGFVYFPEHLGAFPTTRASMPAMLSGAVYRNEQPFEQFVRETVVDRSVASVLARSGYGVRSITFHAFDHQAVSGTAHSVVRYTIPTPYGGYDDYVRFTALQLFDISLFRSVPQPLKRWAYNDDLWRWQRSDDQGGLGPPAARTARPSNHAAFLSDMTARITAAGEAPVYLFVHVALPHPPLVLDRECEFVGSRTVERDAYAEQSRCALRLVGGLLDRLRALGIYDSSAIVLTADHGWRLPRRGHPLAGTTTPAGDLQNVALTAMPLLAVKPFGASGPVRVSLAPTAVTDIPATIAGLAGLSGHAFPGQSVLDIAEGSGRARSFAFHTWGNADWRREYFDALYVFSVDGPIREPASWTFKETR
jgi:phosphoglycerol transferase MdoB-like AlkP superfamily enzyme